MEKVLDGGIKLTGGGRKTIGGLEKYQDMLAKDVLRLRGGHNSATKVGEVGEWWSRPLGEVKDDKGKIYEWDSRHGKLEVYTKNGKTHLGEYDPSTAQKYQKVSLVGLFLLSLLTLQKSNSMRF